MKRSWVLLFCGAFLLVITARPTGAQATSDHLAAGGPEEVAAVAAEDNSGTTSRPAGWTDETHSSDTAPNYQVVFPQDSVNQITINIARADWEVMQADLIEILGPPGAAEQKGPGHRNPIWVPATIEFEGNRWTGVGVRYKGDSTLRDAWSNALSKLPLKLDFDEFEDQFPEIKNQRFYGFKQLSLANSLYDPTYLRDALAYDLLEEAGLAAAETAHYEVHLDYGEGRIRLGLYNMIETVDETVVKRYLQDDSGNIYEGDGRGASLEEGTFDEIRESFQKENNRNQDDWSDVEALYGVLHSEQRITDPAGWRANLESVFDVDAFLKWLAVGAVIDHWDTYGKLPHNYYLYKAPETGRLGWISWDHDLVLGEQAVTSLDKKEVGANWPLIRYLLDDPTYYAAYLSHLEETVNGVFDPGEMEAKYLEIAQRLEPYATEEIGQEAFHTAVQSLFRIARERARAVKGFLVAQRSGNR